MGNKKKETKIPGSKWTVEEQKRKRNRICESLSKGYGLLECLKAEGIHHKTHYNWLKADESYRIDVDAAIRHSCEVPISNIMQHMKDEGIHCGFSSDEKGNTTVSQPTVSMWWLKNRHPDFKEKKEIEHTGEIRTIADLAKEEFDGEQS